MNLKNMFSGTVIMGAALLALCSLCGCSKESSGTSGGEDTPADLTVVKFNVDKKTVLHNPLNGWVMYGSASGDPSYWDREIYVSELGKNVRVRDYASACYIRTSWRTFNPSEGVYAWRDPSTKLYKMIHGALDRGLPIAFRVVVDGRDQGENTPSFVFDNGATYWLENAKYPLRKTPFHRIRSFSGTTRNSSRNLQRTSMIPRPQPSLMPMALENGEKGTTLSMRTAMLSQRTLNALSTR